MENVGNIISQAAIDLKDPKFGHFSKTMLRGWVSEGQREVARRTHCLQKETGDISSLLTPDLIQQSISTLIPDTEVIGYFDVHSNRPLDFTTIQELNRDSSYWRSRTSGEPKKVFPGPNNTLGFWPPASSTWLASNALYIVYSYVPMSDFTNDSQTPDLPKKAWDYIKDFCVLKGKAEDREFTAWDRLYVLWRDGLAFIKSEPRITVRGKVSYVIPRGGVQLHPP